VSSKLARAGRQRYGRHILLDELASKRLEILKEASPRIERTLSPLGHELILVELGCTAGTLASKSLSRCFGEVIGDARVYMLALPKKRAAGARVNARASDDRGDPHDPRAARHPGYRSALLRRLSPL
jgi:hypothetical protein